MRAANGELLVDAIDLFSDRFESGHELVESLSFHAIKCLHGSGTGLLGAVELARHLIQTVRHVRHAVYRLQIRS